MNEARSSTAQGCGMQRSSPCDRVCHELGVPFASFSILPKLFIADDAAKTSQNIVANQGLFVAAIFGFPDQLHWRRSGRVGPLPAPPASQRVDLDVRRVAAARVHRRSARRRSKLGDRAPLAHAAGRPDGARAKSAQRQVHVAIGSFNSQFAFSLIIFGVYLIMLGWLAYRSGYLPKWLGIVLAIDGAGWEHHGSGPLSSAGDRPRLPLRRDLRGTDPFWCGSSAGHTIE